MSSRREVRAARAAPPVAAEDVTPQDRHEALVWLLAVSPGSLDDLSTADASDLSPGAVGAILLMLSGEVECPLYLTRHDELRELLTKRAR